MARICLRFQEECGHLFIASRSLRIQVPKNSISENIVLHADPPATFFPAFLDQHPFQPFTLERPRKRKNRSERVGLKHQVAALFAESHHCSFFQPIFSSQGGRNYDLPLS